MRARGWVGLGLAVAACLGPTAPGAFADSDPASDTLISGDVFYPYSPVSGQVEKQLNAVVEKAKKAGYPVKVALIGSADDLGGVANLYGQAQQYAEFLAGEISFNKPQRLVVVMPQGVGVANADDDEVDAAIGVEQDVSEGDSDGLAKVGMRAVSAMAKKAGHDVPVPEGVGGGGGGGGLSGGSVAAFLVPVVLLLLALLLGHLKRREREE